MVARKDGGRVRLYSRLATDASVFLYAFDLIELDGDDMRREPFETRKATLASLLKRPAPGPRKASPYRSGRSPDWIKSMNPACEAVRREEGEDWGRKLGVLRLGKFRSRFAPNDILLPAVAAVCDDRCHCFHRLILAVPFGSKLL